MAIALVSHARTNVLTTASSANAAAFNLTSGNLVVIGITNYTSTLRTVSSITDTAGNTYQAAKSFSSSANSAEIWFSCTTAGNASNVVTVNWSGALEDTKDASIYTTQWSGASTNAGTIVDVTASGSQGGGGATSLTSGSFTPTTADGVAVYLGATNIAVPSVTAGTSYTLDDSDANGTAAGGGLEHRLLAPASAQTASITWGTKSQAVCAVAVFKMSSGPTTWDTSGTVANAFTLSGALSKLEKEATGTVANAFTTSGDLTKAPKEAAGTAASAFTLSGALAKDAKEASGTLQAAFTPSGQPSVPGTKEADGTVATLFALSGALAKDAREAAGTIASAFTVSGNLAKASKEATGTVASAFALSGGLTKLLDLTGTVANAFAFSGDLTRLLDLTGLLALALGASGGLDLYSTNKNASGALYFTMTSTGQPSKISVQGESRRQYFDPPAHGADLFTEPPPRRPGTDN